MDWVISDELSLTVGTVVGWISAGAMIIGGVIPYIPQFRQIKKSQDAEGFSLLVCLALLIANTLRIMFWFGKHFEYPLLIQSLVMNLTMFIMIHLCVRVRNRNQLIEARQRIFTAKRSEVVKLLKSKPPRSSHNICGNFACTSLLIIIQLTLERYTWLKSPKNCLYTGTMHSDFDLKYFWNWNDFQSYIDCMLVFTILTSLLMYLLIDKIVFVEFVGFLAVFTEAMLGTPQLIKNFKNKSTVGMSLSMVIMWTCGDIFKTLYFLFREAPIQFWICSSIQVAVDLLILLQVYIYKNNNEPQRTLPHRGD